MRSPAYRTPRSSTLTKPLTALGAPDIADQSAGPVSPLVTPDGRPVAVPRLKPETPEEMRRYEAARQRRERRLQERISEEGARG